MFRHNRPLEVVRTVIEESVAWVKNRITQLHESAMDLITLCYRPEHREEIRPHVKEYLDFEVSPSILFYLERVF